MRNLHLWIERPSGWLVYCFSQFRGWKIPIQFGVWRVHSGISWRFNVFCIFRFNLQGSSWFLLVQHILSTISSIYCIFLLMEGLRFGWVIVLFGRDYNGPFMIVIILINYVIHIHKLSGLNTKLLYVKMNINEQIMTISLVYIDVCHCNDDDFEWKNISLIYVWWMELHW